jgi:zinc and cadmium transporter
VAVLTSVPLGVNTAVAVAAHEIPQEVGDVAVLLASGYSRRRALMLNVVSAAAGLLGTLLAYSLVGVIPQSRPFMLALSSASMLYIAMSDLIPGLNRGQMDRGALRQVLVIGTGVATVVLFERLVR